MAVPRTSEVEAGFMDALFADLDASIFDVLPSSPPGPALSQHPPSQLAKRKLSPSKLNSSPVKRKPHLPRPPAVAPSHTAAPAPPVPFWTARLALPDKSENRLGEGLKGKGKEVSKPDVTSVKVEEVNVMELFDGMDWGEDFAPSQGSVKAKPPSIALGKRYIRCEVTDVSEGISETSKRPVKTLTVVLSEDFCKPHHVVLCDDWVATQVEPGDTVNVIGTFSDAPQPTLTIDLSSGFLVLHPDILVSSTKVADSSHCARKALLQELIRTTGGSNPSLVYGNMLHELMQLCMTENNWDVEWRKERVCEIVVREVQTLWTVNLEVDKAVEVMLEKSKGFDAFSGTFIGSSPGPSSFLSDPQVKEDNRPRLAITRTLQIEEDIWSPKFGLKGKVDVSVAGRITHGSFTSQPSIFPLEIKTGRTNAGMEHRAQTMLYTLLMNEEVDSGLLYYSQSNDVFRVKANRNEIRGLIIARNQFATFLHRRMSLSNSAPYPLSPPLEKDDAVKPGDQSGDIKPALLAPELLPPPIDEYRSCKSCYVADACMLYRKAVEGEPFTSEDPDLLDRPLQQRYDERMGHLTLEQAAFFKAWEKLVSLEEQEMVRFKKEIWTMASVERMKLGRCLASMSIDESFESPPPVAGSMIHRFTYRLQHAFACPTQPSRSQQASTSLLGGTFSVNDPVVVSLEDPNILGISRGFVLSISAHHVVLGLDHSLTTIPQVDSDTSDFVFRIDKDELAAGLGRIRDNLIQLFVPGGDDRRRELVVDLRAPEFQTVESHGGLVPKDLNNDQFRAVEKVLAAKDYALILGMPGTGKTTTIAHILKALAKAGKSVLLTSYTHSAVDNILLKLVNSDLSILRLGNRDKIMPALYRYTLDPENPATTLSQLDRQLLTPQIVATTCLAINEPIFTRRTFDVCIVDEASQVTLPTCLGPLRFAKVFILVGDHNQLPPLVRNGEARKGGLDISLFKRLATAHPDSVVELSHQYRMNEDIMLLSNTLIYEGKLCSGSEEIAKRSLHLPRPQALKELHGPGRRHEGPCWLADILSETRKVVFVDTDLLPARERQVGPLIDNQIEAKLVFQTANALIKCGVPQADIGVIAPYRQQIKTLTRRLEEYPGVEVWTADRSQGRDKEVIIMSLTRSNTQSNPGDLLKDWRRINVCLTRAKSKLVVFGSPTTLARVEMLSKFFGILRERDWIYTLPRGSDLDHDGGNSPLVKRTAATQQAGRKRARAGPEKLVLSQPIFQDIVNSL